MANNKRNYVIALVGNNLLVIDPHTEERESLRLQKEASRVLDFYVDSTGIYHAQEVISDHEQTSYLLFKQRFKKSGVEIVDSIKAFPIRHIYPHIERINAKNAIVPINFHFDRQENVLFGYLNDRRYRIFDHCCQQTPESGKVHLDQGKLFFDRKEITGFTEPILKVAEIDAHDFVRELRVKNKFRLDSWRAFLRGV